MPKYELTLREYLTGGELADLRECLEGKKDLVLDCPGVWDKLYEYYLPDMPYGTAKARTGDPVTFVIEMANAAVVSGWEK